MFLLDTNVLSELRRADRIDPKVAAWATSVRQSDLHLSAVTILEIEVGAQLTLRRNPAHGRALRRWIDAAVLPAFADRILPVDTAVAQRCAALHVPVPRPGRDAYVAATGLVHRLTVVTRNVRDFAPMGVALLNPWD